jgi:hypothetical protein
VLDIPVVFKGKNLFYTDCLQKGANNLLPQLVEAPEPLEEINRELEWEVEKVLASQLFSKLKKLQY